MSGVLKRVWGYLEIWAMIEWLDEKFGILDKLNALNEAHRQQFEAAVQGFVKNGWSRKKAEIYAAWEMGLIDDPAAVCRMAGIE